MDESASFEDALNELEVVVRELEEGALPLEAALARYERGVALVRACHERLQQAELRIQKLAGVDAEGKPILEPFAHETSLTTSSPRRGRRKPADAEE